MRNETTNRTPRDFHLMSWPDDQLAERIATAQHHYHHLLAEEAHRSEIRQGTRVEMSDASTDYIALQVASIMLAMEADAGGEGDGRYSDNGLALEVMLDLIQERGQQITDAHIASMMNEHPQEYHADECDAEPDSILTITAEDGRTVPLAHGTFTFELSRPTAESMYRGHTLAQVDRELLADMLADGAPKRVLDQVADRLHNLHTADIDATSEEDDTDA